MNWQLLVVTFISVFLAEVGDKSQLATIALSSGSGAPRWVFLGTAAALLTSSFLGVFGGEWLCRMLPLENLQLLAALGFFWLGLRSLWPKTKGPGA
ncbi:MAG: TMEM165/GDT1 family protein [Gloeomargarita sp. SKYBB_i_bin120]|nr:TMEM165/GDT1 family protein [Gloeomargarita sp. SKYG98]MCS7292068.1 TMEM165/GDT1 family protein [Gloeomargarita sp. SKYB120]MDW8177628.1 TMEM165/GDT1 family protein [Gloeomargarita sp. SKYBB_i_bin120]